MPLCKDMCCTQLKTATSANPTEIIAGDRITRRPLCIEHGGLADAIAEHVHLHPIENDIEQ